MRKERFLTLQFIPDNADKAKIFKLNYKTIRLLIYLLLLTFAAILVFMFNFTNINFKAFASEDLEQRNKSLLEDQKKIASLEKEISKINLKTKIIENVIQTFVITDSGQMPDAPKKADDYLISKKKLYNYVSAIDSIQKLQDKDKPIPRENKPLIWPVSGIITNRFKEQHNGIDIISTYPDFRG